jgi:hypothetical protein
MKFLGLSLNSKRIKGKYFSTFLILFSKEYRCDRGDIEYLLYSLVTISHLVGLSHVRNAVAHGAASTVAASSAIL